MVAASSRRRWLTTWLAIGAVGGTLTWYASSYPLNHDVAWWLLVARRMIEGDRLYGAIIEVNPPLIGYLSMLPLMLSRWSGISVETALEASVLILILLVIASVWRGFRTTPPLGQLMTIGLLLVLVGLPAGDVGQREHLMFILTLPYVLLLWRRLVGLPVRHVSAVGAGLLGGVGFALKPHFVLVWLSLEAWYIFRHSLPSPSVVRRPEVWIVAVCGVTYTLFVLWVHPEYPGVVMSAREVYLSFNRQPTLLLLASPLAVPLGVGALLLALPASRVGELARCFLVYGFAGFVVMVVQGKGWTYHQYPTLAAVVLVTLLVSYDRSEEPQRAAAPVLAGTIGLAVATILVTWQTARVQEWTREWKQAVLWSRLPFFEQVAAADTSLVMLSDLFEDAFPAVTLAGVEWASPFPHVWWIKPLYGSSQASRALAFREGQMGPTERAYLGLLAEGIMDAKPEYILIDAGRAEIFGGRPFPYIDYLSQVPAFDEEWDRYERAGWLDRFEIWRRR